MRAMVAVCRLPPVDSSRLAVFAPASRTPLDRDAHHLAPNLMSMISFLSRTVSAPADAPSVVRLHRDDPLPRGWGSVRYFVEGRALADAVFAATKQGCNRATTRRECDDAIRLIEVDAIDADGGTGHGAGVSSLKRMLMAAVGVDGDFIMAAGQLHVDQVSPSSILMGDDCRPLRMLENYFEGRLLHDAQPGGAEEKFGLPQFGSSRCPARPGFDAYHAAMGLAGL